jgi:hypothetical protein
VRTVAWLCLASGLLAAGDSRGMRPRGSSAEYPAHEAAGGIEVAAAVIPPDQVAKLFATDLNKGGYIVLEVAVYPQAGEEANLLPRDFLMRIGRDPATVRPVSADAIASVLQKRNTPGKGTPPGPHDVTVYPTATIGYESGGYDPMTGRRRSGVYTETGVGVAVGGPGAPPGPASTDRDRDTMRQELTDKGLPEGRTTEAVAGYLYFPKPASAKSKSAAYHITYYGERAQIHLDIPAPKK